MENIVYVVLFIITIILFKIIFKISIKKAKSLKENKEAEKITNKFPGNVEIAKEMLSLLGNESVKIEEAKDTETSLYIAITNKISIADMKNNYARIQTIAHECLHSCQDRTLLLFNFIFSNLNIIYFLLPIIQIFLFSINMTSSSGKYNNLYFFEYSSRYLQFLFKFSLSKWHKIE